MAPAAVKPSLDHFFITRVHEPRDRVSRRVGLALSPPVPLVYSYIVEYYVTNLTGALKE